ncbi:hypothetical protein RSAG8_10553, partial [Rhizoctonia solani AG-8 WAC10335]
MYPIGKPALSCFPRIGPVAVDCGYVPHWVTEFKRHHSEQASNRQVVQGLVSTLYPRRVLGFPNHLVFGTARHTRTVLEVLAATWVPSDEPVGPGAYSGQETNTKSAVPSVGRVDDPSGNSSRGSNAAGGETGIGKTAVDVNTNLTIEDIKKFNKIVVYTIATYSMSAIEDLLELYVLMRHTRTLAQEYKREITGDVRARIRQLSKERTDEWGSQLDSTAEEENEDIVPVDQGDDSDSMSDSEELDSLSDAGPTRAITGELEVGIYTLKNYAYEGDAGNSGIGDP